MAGGEDDSWSNLGLAEERAVFVSPSQNARVLSEGWIAAHMFCPSCGADRLEAFPNNSPVADFGCGACGEEFELKAKNGRLGRKVVDGAYGAMTARLKQRNNPSLLAMAYDRARMRVSDLIVVPNHFFTQAIIEPRKPLGPHCRRAGWQGCNILIGDVPVAGRISLIRDSIQVPKAAILAQWQATLFLRDSGLAARGWLLEVMKAVEDIGRAEFTLDDVYAYEGRLSALYPGNNNVRPKIRQQLQVLRDRGFLEFGGRGVYRRVVH
ncbi:MAG TPA: DpnI domain-containing protein [Caulobacter sp.]|nr:DpnI domain-containing protein [Caulobacter sp.]